VTGQKGELYMHKHCIAPKTIVSLALSLLGLMNWTSLLSQAAYRPVPHRESFDAAKNLIGAKAGPDRALPLPAPRSPEADPATRSRVNKAFASLPVRFEPNQGQSDPRVKFISRNDNYAMFLTATEAVLLLTGPAPMKTGLASLRSAVLRMKLEGANPAAEIEGMNEQAGKSNYFVGSDSSGWRTNIPGYGRVQYRNIYPGIDLIYYGTEGSIEYDFVVAAGADYRDVKLSINGSKKIRVDASGDLVLSTPVGEVRQRKPFAYQEIDGERREVSASYRITGKRQVRFKVGEHDPCRPLVIDPVLDYATFLGGTSTDEARSIALDDAGNAYVTGRTASFNFPVTLKAFDTTYANSFDVFVTKLNASGSSLVYSTFLGGNLDDSGFGIVVDSTGNAYVTGSTRSVDYPTTPGAFQTTFAGGASSPSDVFVTKVNNDGTALLYSTYLGGTNSDQAAGIAVDSSGNAYLTGSTSSTAFPTTPGAFQTVNALGTPLGDAFITKVNSTGTDLVYSTYLGGARSDQGSGIVVDAFGRAYVSGSTNSIDFDTTVGAFQTTFGGSSSTTVATGDAFVTELNDSGSGLVYSSYMGGLSDDGALGIGLNASGEAFITGLTSSVNFPVTPGVVRVANGGAVKSTDAAGSWSAINAGITDSTILSFAINPNATSTVYAGSNSGGVFKSTNAGTNWSASNLGLTSLTIRSLAVDPSTPSIVYLGTNSRGVFRSTDSGNSWRGINTGQGGNSVNSLGVDPANTSVIYAGTDAGAFKTTNGGASWTGINTGIGGNFIQVLTIDPVNTATLHAGTFSGAFRSTNGGQNWTLTNSNIGAIKTIVVDPQSPSSVYAGGDRGVFKSTDQGSTWRAMNIGLSNRTVNALAINPLSPSVLYAGTAAGVFKSTNAGGLWVPANSGMAGSVINTLALDPILPATLYAGLAGGGQDGFATRVNAAGSALVYSTYIGGSSFDNGAGIAIDSSDIAYIIGQTSSNNFPTTPGTFPKTNSFDTDSFVTKLSATGTDFVYSTVVGGFNTDQGFGIAINSAGNAYVVGSTTSGDFPVTPGAYQTAIANSTDGFVAKINEVPSLSADLDLTLTGPSGTLTAGQDANYQITLTNNGPDRAFSVVLTDVLSPQVTFSFCNSQFGGCSSDGSAVTFTASSIAPGQSLTATVFGFVNCTGPPSGTIDNTLTVESSTPDPDATNNIRTVSNESSNPPFSLVPTKQIFSPSGGFGSLSVQGPGCSWSAISNVGWVTVGFFSGCCNGIVQYNVAANPGAPRTGTMTIAGQTFIVEQGGSVSKTTIGLFRPSDNSFFLRNMNSLGPPDVAFGFGAPGDLPIVGDWDGDGDVTVGLYRPSTSTFFLRNSNAAGPPDHTITFGDGPGGDLPIAGDWDGNGTWTIGVYRPATSTFFIRNTNSSGVPNIVVSFGAPGDMPLAGDWDGDGVMTIGLFRPSGNFFFLRNANTAAPPDVALSFGAPGDLPLVGDWDGNGTTTIGLFRPSSNFFFLRDANTLGPPDTEFTFGAPGDKPIAGNWDGL
jgi:uncharacterized repeat protein (TIGR01451 family)